MGVKVQIKYQMKQSEQEQAMQEEVAIGIITKFLMREIEYNCEIIDGRECILSKDRFLKDKPVQFGYEHSKIKFDEFNKVKFDLLKYKSKVTNDIFDIYDKFYILSIHSDVNKLTDQEFNWVKDLYGHVEKLKVLIKNNDSKSL